MLQFIRAAVLANAAAVLAACSPAFNWREVRVQATALKAMFPCKPEKETRTVTMAGRQVDLAAWGCRSGGATFAVLSGDIGDAGRADEVLGQWKAATLASLHSAGARETSFHPAGALELPHSVRMAASGQRPDGSKVQGQAAYFAQGGRVFQAVIYSEQLPPEAAEVFFSGLKFE